ncbi:hypothetical protein C7212DRAFT_366706 [Tuber magnatum]|uniref:Uncharacterized protein n=1 Tax=Tuber magnatum TaxID=42249 RepID=A0A317SEZ3_9PEZI|nr:hypothetical protein C7212DRAFT_366706 [Tuber magnatum]
MLSWEFYSEGLEVDDRFVHNQNDLNRLFRSLNLSLDDPNRVADVLTEMSNEYWGVERERTNSLTEQEWSDAQEKTLLLRSMLQEIRGLRFHRHRVDAANIIDEVDRRLRDPSNSRRVDPIPMCLPYTGPLADDYASRWPAGRRELSEMMATRYSGDPVPLPPPFQHPPLSSIPQERVLPAENTGLSYWVEQPRDGLHWMRLLQLKAKENPGHPIPEYLDNPAESFLNYPDHFPLIDGPVPEVTPWREEDIRKPIVYDSRKGTGRYMKRESEDSYLYKFVHLVQNVLLQPEVAMKYTIILRATRGRYLDPGPDNIWDEPAPTSTEVQQLLNWFATGFPTVVIERNGNSNLSGTHNRWLTPDRIHLSGEQFDLIERGQRENKPIAHRFYRMYCALFHEMGHYLNTHINAPLHKNFLTPRKLRWYIQPRGVVENPTHPRFYMLFPHTGEIGQIIEMLVFGHKINILTMYPNAGITVHVRGSTSGPYGESRAQITIPHEVLEYMFFARVPLRMDGHALRQLIRGLEITKQEAQSGLSREVLLGSSRIDPDAIAAGQEIPSGYGGYRYRRAIRRLQKDLLEMAYGIEESPLAQVSEEYYGGNEIFEENPYGMEDKWEVLWNLFIFLCCLPIIYLIGLPVGAACGLSVYCGVSTLEGGKLLRGWWRWYIRYEHDMIPKVGSDNESGGWGAARA